MASWPAEQQVEQDLVLSRALVDIFSDAVLAEELAFRGGTALHKLYLPAPARYSEDLDLVQVKPGPIGELMHQLQARLDPWLGSPATRVGPHRLAIFYHYLSESQPPVSMRVKIEINTREHFTVLGLCRRTSTVTTPWFAGTSEIVTYALEELLATKLRALFQRRKGRDLFDLVTAFDQVPELEGKRVVATFTHYLRQGGGSVSRAQFEANLAEKLTHPAFVADVLPLLRAAPDLPPPAFDLNRAARIVRETLLVHLPGAAWKGTPSHSRR